MWRLGTNLSKCSGFYGIGLICLTKAKPLKYTFHLKMLPFAIPNCCLHPYLTTSWKAVMVYKSLNCLAPDYMSSKFILRSDLFNSYNLRISESKLTVPLPRTNYYRNSFCYSGAVLWNNLPTDVRQAKSLTCFRKLLTSSSNTTFMENRL